jgi:hypothetical protein
MRMAWGGMVGDKEMPDIETHVRELRSGSLRCFQHGDLAATAGDSAESARVNA